ncbi:MAG: hypothetical protein C0478_14565 [Planctomyces sp.]|nr:hypothetical protein [Planctomyces sp.]
MVLLRKIDDGREVCVRPEQAFNRRSAVEFHRKLAASRKLVNFDASGAQTTCDSIPGTPSRSSRLRVSHDFANKP